MCLHAVVPFLDFNRCHQGHGFLIKCGKLFNIKNFFFLHLFDWFGCFKLLNSRQLSTVMYTSGCIFGTLFFFPFKIPFSQSYLSGEIFACLYM